MPRINRLHRRLKTQKRAKKYAAQSAQVISIFLAWSFCSLSHADVYKCSVNGKIVYSDSRCAYAPAVIKADPNQNVVQGARSSAANSASRSLSAAKDPKCEKLLDQLSETRFDRTGGTFGDAMDIRARRREIQQEYELRCMSQNQREASMQNRSTEQMEQMNRQLIQIQIKQQEIQNRQRGLGY